MLKRAIKFIAALALVNSVESGVTGELQTVNSAGRSGAYFLPEGYSQQALPFMLAFHGTGGNGQSMVNLFKGEAESVGFIIVAPDSRVSPTGEFTWEVGNTPGEVTPDYSHALDCLAEVRALNGVALDDNFVLAAGYSGGGSSAPYIATNEEVFTHFASMHGGLVAEGLGENVIPGWFSTGTNDNFRPPSLVESYKDHLEVVGYEVVYMEYPGGHEVSDSEKNELIVWWMGQTVAGPSEGSAAEGSTLNFIVLVSIAMMLVLCE